MPRNRSPIGSLARAADCASRLSGLPGRIGGAARGETEPDACVTAGTAAAAAFGTEIGTAGARGEVAAETGGDALEAAGAPVSAGAGPPAFSESKAANGGDGSAAGRGRAGRRYRSPWIGWGSKRGAMPLILGEDCIPSDADDERRNGCADEDSRRHRHCAIDHQEHCPTSCLQ